MKERDKRNQIVKISVVITSIFIIFLSITYAFFSFTIQGTKKQIITAGNLSLELQEDTNNISITDALPMYDEVGMMQEAFTFTLVNNGPLAMEYKLQLKDITESETNKLDTSIVKYGLLKNDEERIELLSQLTNNMIDEGRIFVGESIKYQLRFWIDSSVEDNSLISGKSLSYKLELVAEMIHNYTVTFHANGGTGEDEVIVCYEQEDCILATTGISKENNIIAGWETTDGTFYANHAVVKTMPLDQQENVDLYAIWSTDYLYNQGNQYADITGGWNYTSSFSSYETSTQWILASESAAFGSSYMQWYELTSDVGKYNNKQALYFGRGYFQHANLVNLKNAQSINFDYMVTNATPYSAYYPNVTFYVLDSDGTPLIAEVQNFSAGSSVMQTLSLDVSQYDMSSIRIRIECSTMSHHANTLNFQLYSVYPTY